MKLFRGHDPPLFVAESPARQRVPTVWMGHINLIQALVSVLPVGQVCYT